MTNWIEWNGGECPIKSDMTRVEYKCGSGYKATNTGKSCRWSHVNSGYDIIAYRIVEDHEPKMTREQITSQIEALQKQLDAMPVVERYWINGGAVGYKQHPYNSTHYFDIKTINGVPHIHGVAMKEVLK
jgi:hypothetical protein